MLKVTGISAEMYCTGHGLLSAEYVIALKMKSLENVPTPQGKKPCNYSKNPQPTKGLFAYTGSGLLFHCLQGTFCTLHSAISNIF